MRFEGARQDANVLFGAFESDVFHPKGIGVFGCIKGTKKKKSFYGGRGWGLEHFVSRFVNYFSPIGRLEFETPPSEPWHNYLMSLGDAIRQDKLPITDLSPHEERDDEYGVMFLHSPDLGAVTLDECAGWLGDLEATAVKLLTSRWFPSEPEISELNILSGSFIWLREYRGLCGRVGPSEADVNLERLARLAETLANNRRLRFVSASLHLEGRTFHQEAERFETAFNKLGIEPGQSSRG
jgi:hypothetical protein